MINTVLITVAKIGRAIALDFVKKWNIAIHYNKSQKRLKN